MTVTYELRVNDSWIRTELRDLKKGDVFRVRNAFNMILYTYRAIADAEYWEEDEKWGVMADDNA